MPRRNITPMYFKFITFLLHTVAAFHEEKIMNSELKTFLVNKVWPVVFFLIWTPLVPMVSLKIHQFTSQKRWDDLLDIMHMFILGCNTLYYVAALQKTAKHYKNVTDLVNNHFKTSHLFRFQNETWVYVLCFFVPSAYVLCYGTNMYYGENLVPLWVPFLDNDKPLPIGVYIFIWFYEGVAGCYMVLVYAILAPFIVVITSVIRTEIFYLIRQLEQFRYYGSQAQNVTNNYEHRTYFSGALGFENSAGNHDQDEYVDSHCFNENDTKRFIRAFVIHHYRLKRTIDEVGQIHQYIFFTQDFLTITHSCFLTFTMYYTDHLLKVVLKYSPILVLSYYLLYLYCWNGQRLTDTCEELQGALYRCRWIGAPQSFKRSLIIISEYCKRPVSLTGGGIFSASLHTFLQGLQQSFSYILILKAMTPERSNS